MNKPILTRRSSLESLRIQRAFELYRQMSLQDRADFWVVCRAFDQGTAPGSRARLLANQEAAASSGDCHGPSPGCLDSVGAEAEGL